MSDATIRDVSDTALWVANYRSLEGDRPDALFKDPLAKKLIGDRGAKIAQSMSQASEYTKQNVIIRTVIIDQYLRELIASGVETVINLGAGLDTRPYRLNLGAEVRWIEVDFPHLIEAKTRSLAGETPQMQLERVSLDLGLRPARQELFGRLAREARRAVILTEGVLPYLKEADVAALAEDLRVHPQFEFWICDYMAKETYKYLQNTKRLAKLKNAPFVFYPEDWFGFFKAHGWAVDRIRYIQKTTRELGRPTPMPLFARLMTPFLPRKIRERFNKMSGYLILRRD